MCLSWMINMELDINSIKIFSFLLDLGLRGWRKVFGNNLNFSLMNLGQIELDVDINLV